MDLRLPTDLNRRTEPVSAKRAQVERDVLRAVDELLCDGMRWNDLSIERITTRAGISRTAFYFYFKDKRELLMRLVSEVGAEVYAASAWLNREGEEDAVATAMHAVNGIYQEHGALLQAVVEVSAVDETVAAVFHEIMDALTAATAARMAEVAGQDGTAPVVPYEHSARALIAMTEHSFYSWRVRGEEVTDAHVDALTAIWVRTVYGA